ncbi:extracellular solute-binding protein [Fundidesulfovibrio magnetotacticus]|uniref:extracellular solute-binding protein n=1 Tax=Fundidesulfovibrio magnetotacticus TaxID=2730080 RepID=UPI0015644190|nr:extracellular solute-binding protein [Fundidesulfovibrio magnetotacticus]
MDLVHYWTGDLSGGIENMIEEFNRQAAGYSVVPVGLEHEMFKVGILSRIASGKKPMLFSYWAGAKVQALVDAGSVDPLDAIWNTGGLRQCFTPAVASACIYNGRPFAIPVTQHYVAFFYNKRLFASHGLTTPATWTELVQLCERIASLGVTPIALGNRERWPAQFWFDYILLRTAGPQYRQELMQGLRAYTDPEVRRVFDLWGQLIEKGAFTARPEADDWAGAAGAVRDGTAAMTLMGTWIIGHYSGDPSWSEGEDYDFFVFPTIDPGVPLAALGPIDVLLKSRGGTSEAGDTALLFFAGVQAQTAMSRGSGALAPNTGVPGDAYSDMRRRILAATYRAPHWAFNYDLATPQSAADIGLGCFSAFLKHPETIDALLQNTQHRMASIFLPQTR